MVLRLASRMLRMVITRAWALLSAVCRKVSLFFSSSFKLTSRKLQMVIPRTWLLLSASCLKVLLFFASSFKADF